MHNFAQETKEETDMEATISMESLWQMIQTLSPSNKHWLSEKLLEEDACRGEELVPYTMEELNARVDDAEVDFAAGRGIPSEVAHQRMKQFIANL